MWHLKKLENPSRWTEHRGKGQRSQGAGKKLGSLKELGFPVFEIKTVSASVAYATEIWWGSRERRALWLGYLCRGIDVDPAGHKAFSVENQAGITALNL